MSHFYDLQGNPVYEVDRSDGKGKRDTTIADARKRNLVASVTTIIKTAAAPGLEVWKMQQALIAALKHKHLQISDTLSEKQWMAIVLSESKKIAEETSKRGTEIHNGLEQIFLTGEVDEKDAGFLNPAIESIKETLGASISKAIPEKAFAHKDGYGGKVDLSGIHLPWDQDGFVIDFKTKNKEIVDKSCATIEHCMQVAAYRKGLDLPTAKCYNLYISALKPGQVYMHHWTEEELQKGEQMFYCLLNYFKLVNKL